MEEKLNLKQALIVLFIDLVVWAVSFLYYFKLKDSALGVPNYFMYLLIGSIILGGFGIALLFKVKSPVAFKLALFAPITFLTILIVLYYVQPMFM